MALVAPSFGDRRCQLGGSWRQRVSPRACSLAARTRELTVIGTALTPRVHAVQVDSCVLAGAVAPQLLETATMSLRLSCLLIEVSALLRRCLLCFAAHPVRHARRRWRRFDLWTIWALPQLKEANVYLGGNPGNAELVKGVLRERKGSK